MSYWKPGLVAVAAIVAVIAIMLERETNQTSSSSTTVPISEPAAATVARAQDEAAPQAPSQVSPDESGAEQELTILVPEDHRPFYAHYRERRRVCNGVFPVPNSQGEMITLPNCWEEVERSEFHDFDDAALITMVTEGQPYAIEALEVLAHRAFRAGRLEEGAEWVKLHAARSGKPGLLHNAQVSYLSAGTTQHQKIVFQFIEILIESGYPGYEASMAERQRNYLIRLGVSEAEILELERGSAEILSRMERVAVGGGAAASLGFDTGGAA